MEILNNSLIHWRTKVPEKYAHLPRYEVVDEPIPGCYEMVAPWDLETAKLLRNMGVKSVPSPIHRTYKWPGRFTPMAHQKETASFLTLHHRAFVFNEAGTGKSVSCLWAADYLMNKGMVKRVLIMCPLSIMEAAWMNDVMSSVIHRSVAIAYNANMSKRADIINAQYDICIINYDGVVALHKTLLQNDYDLVIVDEGNCVKNTSTHRWKAVRSLISRGARLWLLTGTPAPQSPLDAYGLAKLVNPDGVPQSLNRWKDLTMRQVTTYKWAPKAEAPDIVHRALQPAIRFTKAQCLDLPPVLTTARESPMTAQQKKYYDLIKRDAFMETGGETVTAVNAAVVLSKLLQISAGATYTDDKAVVEFDCHPRLALLDEVLDDTDKKVLVFANYTHSQETILRHLRKQGVDCAEINGNVSANERNVRFSRFQSPTDPMKVLVIQPQAAAHGVTLTAADTVVFWGPVMSVEMYIQCIARADRIGQVGKNVTVVHLQSSEAEKKMFKQLAERVEGHISIVQLYEEVVKGEKQ